jgi:hypothetical protein
LAVAVSLLGLAGPAPARAADNDDLELRINALLGTHNAALPFSLLPDPVVSISASSVTFAANLGLKKTRAVFVTPEDWAAWPNAAGGCLYEFDLPQSKAVHSDLLGFIPFDDVPANWGNLTGLGGPVQVHRGLGTAELR